MTRKTLLALSIALLAAVCGKSTTSVTQGPSAGTLGQLTGTWASTAPVIPSPLDSCSSFNWTVTELTSNTATGTFTAACLGVMDIVGSGKATLSGGVISWTVNATGRRPEIQSCVFALNGTMQIQGTQLTVAWTGTSCFGPLTGTTEILKKS